MTKYRNSHKDLFLKELSSLISLENDNNDHTLRSKFNFSYFDSSQAAGQDFGDWTQQQLAELLRKIKEYTNKSLEYWRNQRAGGGSLKVFTNYECFPKNSNFEIPKHVPHQALWGRFRLGNKMRLVGFTVPSEFDKKPHQKTRELYDKNTFYVVFLDRDHRFYLTEKD